MWAIVAVLGVVAQDAASSAACDAAIATARTAYERREYSAARTAFADALPSCGTRSPLLLALAQAELLDRDVPAALATLNRLEALGRLDVPALKVRARALYLVARDRDAELTLLAAATTAPTDPEIPYDLGRIYYQQQRHQEAKLAFERAVTLDARAYKAWDNLGLTEEALGDADAATRHYARAMAIAQTEAPGYDVVYANYADLLIKEGQYQRAFDAAAEAATRNAADARNFVLAGKALARLGAHDVALRWLSQAATLDPDLPEPHYLLARSYRQLGRLDEARASLAAFQAAAARAPQVRR